MTAAPTPAGRPSTLRRRLRVAIIATGIGLAVAMGVFAGCTPALGFHGGLAVGLATLARLNRLWAFIGSRVSNFVIMPWIILGEVQLAHRVRTGNWLTITLEEAPDRAPELLLDWCLGTLPVGGGLAVIFGFVAYGLSRRRASRANPAA